MIHFACPACHHVVEASDGEAASLVACPACQRPFAGAEIVQPEKPGFTCPDCLHVFDGAEADAGSLIQCPNCTILFLPASGRVQSRARPRYLRSILVLAAGLLLFLGALYWYFSIDIPAFEDRFLPDDCFLVASLDFAALRAHPEYSTNAMTRDDKLSTTKVIDGVLIELKDTQRITWARSPRNMTILVRTVERTHPGRIADIRFFQEVKVGQYTMFEPKNGEGAAFALIEPDFVVISTAQLLRDILARNGPAKQDAKLAPLIPRGRGVFASLLGDPSHWPRAQGFADNVQTALFLFTRDKGIKMRGDCQCTSEAAAQRLRDQVKKLFSSSKKPSNLDISLQGSRVQWQADTDYNFFMISFLTFYLWVHNAPPGV
ncbi:MAG: hypothetical protein AB7K24_19980 [Gemmataceae bacterium]